MARSLNKVTLIGNLTRDPELRYTPQGTAVCSFGLATNRQWTTDAGEKKEEADFHRIVAWNKLAEICAQLLKKGRKVYVEGRLQTRNWQTQDGQPRQTTEVVISDMILLDSRGGLTGEDFNVPEQPAETEGVGKKVTGEEAEVGGSKVSGKPTKKSTKAKKTTEVEEKTDEQVDEEDIPF